MSDWFNVRQRIGVLCAVDQQHRDRDPPGCRHGTHLVDTKRATVITVPTDVLPLLVNACSNDCVSQLPQPADRYPPHPHRGGEEFPQPPREFRRIG
jgi:hypothetical protein